MPSGGRRQVFPPDQLGELMAASDYVVMALPHTPATDKLVGRDALAALRPHAVLVNIGARQDAGRGRAGGGCDLCSGCVHIILRAVLVASACAQICIVRECFGGGCGWNVALGCRR